MVGLATAGVVASGFQPFAEREPGSSAAVDFLKRHMNVLQLLQVPLLAALGVVFFGRRRRNFAEQLVLAAYATSLRVATVAFVFVPSWMLLRPERLDPTALRVYLGLWVAYYGWACAQFHDGPRWASALKGAAVASLAQLTTWLAVEHLGGVWFAIGPGH